MVITVDNSKSYVAMATMVDASDRCCHGAMLDKRAWWLSGGVQCGWSLVRIPP